ncbi:MAG TPA: TraR/DksA C4-type zinc finger protein [Iamia sp.]|nr:TraR/DksA C4-type zinc finger protein [Iamia sp.]
MALSETARAELRRVLVEDRDRTAEGLAALERSFDELVAAADLEPPDDEHDPDGTTAYERAQVSSLAAEARVRLAALDEALATEADLGTCAACAGDIGWERLLAVPGTRHCVTCAAAGA